MNLGALTMTCLGLVLGQTPGDVVYHHERSVRVPIVMQENRRAELKALVLFASEDEGRSYHEVASILPDKTEFIFNAKSDGTYWLKAAVINLLGKQEPDNIQDGPPHQKLIIDTLKPALRITSAQRQGDEVIVSWEVKEDHPDWTTFRLEFQARDNSATWTAIQAAAGITGKAQFKPGKTSSLVIRLSFADLAGNQSTATTELAGTVATTAFTQNQPPTLPAVAPPAPTFPKETETSPPILGKGTGVAPLPPNPWTANPMGQEPTKDLPNKDLPSKPVASTDAPPTSAGPAPPLQQRPLPALQYVNHPRVMLEYELNKVGPSGVGKVELWYTTNDGQSWELCADDPRVEGATSGGRHQRVIDLPGDGVYGFHLVVKSRAGLGKPPPRAGDPPQIRFEVDTSIPTAQLFPPVPDPQAPGSLLLRWTAKDNNLTETPITIEWSERRDGPWTAIAANIPNTGKHSWQLPERMPVQAFLRLRVRDLAGNEGVAVTTEAQLIDLSEPEGRLINVSVSPKR